MNVNDAFPSKYIKADDLQGREVTVTIDRVEMENIGQGQNQDRKPVAYFQGKQKGLVLNKTNSMNIASVYGPETSGWTGRQVTLFSAWVDYQGKSVQAVRVRPAFAQGQQAPVAPSARPPQQAPAQMPPARQAGADAGYDEDVIPF